VIDGYKAYFMYEVQVLDVESRAQHKDICSHASHTGVRQRIPEMTCGAALYCNQTKRRLPVRFEESFVSLISRQRIDGLSCSISKVVMISCFDKVVRAGISILAF
jgi:hypothetical protein